MDYAMAIDAMIAARERERERERAQAQAQANAESAVNAQH
jgi:hypothetical protein